MSGGREIPRPPGDALLTAPARGSGRGDLTRRPGAGKESGPRPAGADYVRWAPGGMKGAGGQLRLRLRLRLPRWFPLPLRSHCYAGRRGQRPPPGPSELGARTQAGVRSVSGRSPGRGGRRSGRERRCLVDWATPRECSAARSAPGLGRGQGSLDLRDRGRGSRRYPPAAQSGPQPRALRPVSAAVWVPPPPFVPSDRLSGGAGNLAVLPCRAPGKRRPDPRLPAVGSGGATFAWR
ncbi:hypothetical protein P7K49_005220 [Saguinus oedipus]|uniref:Uncharacterized protein n=1 Tax=Saguinus oedipus TaxID=9490 RepID=A0ABQ9W9M7_SAGOE|nr:hypothetical protein P7K49_005220 [Saguinus oedipus]